MQETDADPSHPDGEGHASEQAESAPPPSDRSDAGELCLPLPRQLRFSCTKQEREEAQELAFIESHGGLKWKAIGCAVIGVGIGFVALLLEAGPGHRLPAIAGVLAIAVLVMAFQKMLGRRAGEAAVELEISEHGLRFVGPASSSTIAASSFEKLLESDKLFALKSKAMLILLPKRVFENDEERAGFRALAAGWIESKQGTAVRDDEALAGPADALSVEFRLQFRDYVDRFLASWRLRAISLVLFLFLCGVFAYVSLQPIPNAVYSCTEVFVYFMLPAFVVQMFILFVVICVFAWFSERPYRCETRVTFHGRGIEQVTATDKAMLAWSQTARFKESPWTFFIWWPGTQAWMMVPKRAFGSEGEIHRCRAFLVRHAGESTWFWW